MKRTYVVQLVIDFVIIILGLCTYIFPDVASINPNVTFYLMMGAYAVMELLEYLLDHSKKEPLYIFLASATAAFSGMFLREYSANYVLSITIAVWILMIGIIKIISLEEIFEKKTHLFLIKLTAMSVLILFGILVSVNLYYRISTTIYMLGFLYMSYGFIEAVSDFLSYLSEDSKFLKE